MVKVLPLYEFEKEVKEKKFISPIEKAKPSLSKNTQKNKPIKFY